MPLVAVCRAPPLAHAETTLEFWGLALASSSSSRLHWALLSSACPLFNYTSLIYFAYVRVCVWWTLHAEVRGQLVDVLSFHHVGSEDQTQVIRLGGKCLDALSHLLAHLCFNDKETTFRENSLLAPLDKAKHLTTSHSASILFIIRRCLLCSCSLQRRLQDIP